MTNVGNDRSQLSPVAKRAKATLEVENLDAVADRGYFDSEEILACEEAGITVTLPKPMTSGINVRGRFGKQDFRYVAEQDVYICPAGKRLAYHYTNEEHELGDGLHVQLPSSMSVILFLALCGRAAKTIHVTIAGSPPQSRL